MIILDIETAPVMDAAQWLEMPTAPANYKDPEKIAAYIAEREAKQLADCALDPDLCQVVAVGVYHGIGAHVRSLATHREADLLSWAASYMSLNNLVGFNVLWDLHVLARRALYLQIEWPAMELDRYRHPQVIDLLEILSGHGRYPMRSLDWYCRRFGLDVPTDPISGADIPRLVTMGDWAAIEAHCAADLAKTRTLAARIGVVR